MRRSIAALIVALLLVGCGDKPASVDWENYPDDLKSRIDASGCQELNRLFQWADDTSLAQQRGPGNGDGNSDLMIYIQERRTALGCP
jgi:hypothetical protein